MIANTGITDQQWEAAAKLGITLEIVEAAGKAHWASWDRMRPDVQRERRYHIVNALIAAFSLPRKL